MATDLPTQILHKINASSGPLSSSDFPDVPTLSLKAALDSLKSRDMVTYTTVDAEVPVLTPEAESIVEKGSHEARVYEAVLSRGMEGLAIGDLEGVVGKESAKVGQGKAFKEGWIRKEGAKLVKMVDSITDSAREVLSKIGRGETVEAKTVTDLKKRKLVKMEKRISFKDISKGEKFATEIIREETDLTAELLASGAWESKTFKPYNFNALGAPATSGALHPLNKVRSEFRRIFFEMGFTEMPTNRFVESGFWNFDTLFVPQQHPARDLQDTFYIADPPKADKPRDEDGNFLEEYWNNVREVHEQGKYGSIGYRYPWNEDESLRLVLRTHTTAVSAAMLHKLAKNPGPAKMFSIDRVFRNETVDATHLAEFHQVEGVIADYDLTLGDLIGFMKTFFTKMGMEDLRFKPAYNPYTEPSMEIFGYHEGLGKWVEIGNSGMFRPEMLEAMGLPKDLRVHGWGLSLERPTMIRYAIKNIRELLGHKVDLNMVENNAAVRLEKV
ncbi:hypothetical protein BJ508DRAFT_235515 [Ascobolus immersus RN42]|uniref:Phenylalanine--tRNA ligase alpha subunit n=1 Tax=Ascobolus immersus RN42 TaxID=1160509 RepID=A0A3N4IMH2_ASCIM|nr:hypothetical protein BJ508DRAFT_235515 [Ascobolus immersus RN42]